MLRQLMQELRKRGHQLYFFPYRSVGWRTVVEITNWVTRRIFSANW